jgi:hypothetical protein
MPKYCLCGDGLLAGLPASGLADSLEAAAAAPMMMLWFGLRSGAAFYFCFVWPSMLLRELHAACTTEPHCLIAYCKSLYL